MTAPRASSQSCIRQYPRMQPQVTTTVGNQLLDFLIDAEATRFVKNRLSKPSSEARISRNLEKAFSPATGGESDGTDPSETQLSIPGLRPHSPSGLRFTELNAKYLCTCKWTLKYHQRRACTLQALWLWPWRKHPATIQGRDGRRWAQRSERMGGRGNKHSYSCTG